MQHRENKETVKFLILRELSKEKQDGCSGDKNKASKEGYLQLNLKFD